MWYDITGEQKNDDGWYWVVPEVSTQILSSTFYVGLCDITSTNTDNRQLVRPCVCARACARVSFWGLYGGGRRSSVQAVCLQLVAGMLLAGERLSVVSAVCVRSVCCPSSIHLGREESNRTVVELAAGPS